MSGSASADFEEFIVGTFPCTLDYEKYILSRDTKYLYTTHTYICIYIVQMYDACVVCLRMYAVSHQQACPSKVSHSWSSVPLDWTFHSSGRFLLFICHWPGLLGTFTLPRGLRLALGGTWLCFLQWERLTRICPD